MKNMGLKAYRFSVAWTRIIKDPLGSASTNGLGVQYYKNLIDELLKNDIQPVITLYHSDLPQKIQEDGNIHPC